MTEKWLEQARKAKSQAEFQHQQLVAQLEGQMEKIQQTTREMQIVHTSETDQLKMENSRLQAEVAGLLRPKKTAPEVMTLPHAD